MNDYEIRKALNIHFCATCGVDTMPSDLTGKCFFCDRVLCAPVGPEAPGAARYCEHCNKELPDDKDLRARFCGEVCRKAAWLESPAGIDYAYLKAAQRKQAASLCRNCGQPTASRKGQRGRPAVYCSDKCARRFWQRKQNAARREQRRAA